MLKIGDGKLISEQEYKSLTDGLKKDAPTRARDLTFFWNVGRQLNALVKKPAYGRSFVMKLARDIGINVVLLYDARKFHARWPSEEDLKGLIEKNIGWTTVRHLVSTRLTASDRKSLLDYIVKEQPTTNEVRARVRKIVSAKAV